MVTAVGESAEQGKGRGRQGRGIPLPGLRDAREDALLSQEALQEATASGGIRKVYRSTISEIESGARGARPETARALAAALGTSVRTLRTPPGVGTTGANPGESPGKSPGEDGDSA